MNVDYMKEKERVFPVIKARKNFLLSEIPSHHPSSIKYLKFWKEQKRRCIEGFWAKDKEDDEWRFMTPNLYFYVNFGTILHKPEGMARTASKQRIRPYLRDIEWAFFYNFIEARGFSGYKDDDEFSCCSDIIDHEKGDLDLSEVNKSCFDKDEKLKIYISPRNYIRKKWHKPMGLPLYFNEAKNLMLLGARGFGKSFCVGVGVILYEILFDSAKEYTEESIKNPAVAEVFVGAAISSKSSDILAKTYDAYINLPGVWSKGTEEEQPSPFYKDMNGSLRPNNMKSPWSHSYEKKVAGKWQKFGSKSHVYHGIWTTENPEAAAGTRPGIIVVEEVGLVANLLTIHGGNSAAQMTDGTDKFGSSIYIGTSGNMEKIVEAEIIFRDPEGFEMMEFNDEWEDSGNIGWFMPAIYADGKYKDNQGNTIVDSATKNYEARRVKKKKARSRTALDLEMMNYPLVPSEMFLNVGNNRFPIADIKQRYADVLSSSKILDATWKGRFKINSHGVTKWENTSDVPIYEYPVKDNQDIHGAVHMFEPPKRNGEGELVYGRYIAGLDPVDDDDDNANNSLQSFWIMDVFTDRIVLEYSARTRYATEFYEQVRRALLYYNATVNYENQKKGFYAYMKNKVSLHLLADTPEILRDMDIQKTSRVGNKAHPYSQHVHTPNGLKRWEDIQIGDTLFGTDLKETKVIDIPFDDNTDIYQVTLKDGRTIEASDNHLWKVIDWGKREKILTTGEIAQYYYRDKGKYKEYKYYIPANKGVEYQHKKTPIDPYLLGLLLGDGCFTQSSQNNACFASNINDMSVYSSHINYDYITFDDRHHSIRIPNIKDKLIELDLHDKKSRTKFVPNIYKFNSYDVRMSVLQGLLDTDGTISYGGNSEYTSVSKQLSVDVLELARSLGINCNLNIKKNEFGLVYTVRLYTDKKLFKLPRKHAKQKITKTRAFKTAIIDIKYIGKKKAKCVTVDAEDNCYLIGDYVSTHNSKGTSANVAVNNWGLELQLEWLESKAYDREDELMNLYLIKSPAYLRELILFDGKRNADRISAMGMLLIYRQEKLQLIQSMKKKKAVDNDSFSSNMLSDIRKTRKRYSTQSNSSSFRRF